MNTLKQYKKQLAILFLFGSLLYANTFSHNYVLDDFSVIKENIIVKKGTSAIPEIFKTHYRQGYGYVQGNLYRPLALSLFAIQWELAPDSPSFAHAFNILLYGILIAVLFLFLNHIFKNELISFLASLLFAAHPIHTEVVANIKSIDDIMAFLCFLIAMLFLFKNLETKKLKHLTISITLIFIGFLSKESTVTFLAVIPLILILFKAFNLKKAIIKTFAYLIPFAAYLAMRTGVLGSISGDKTVAKIDNMLLAAPNKAIEIATAIKLMGLYVWKLILPHPLMNDYSLNQISFSNFSDIYVILSLVTYSTMIFFLIRFWKKNQIIVFGIAFFLINIALYSNLVLTIGTSFGERLLFIPSLGFCIILAYLIHLPFKNKQFGLLSLKNKPLLICSVILALYSFKTIDRNKAWENNFSLYSTDVKNCSNSARCQYYYGLGLMKEKAILLPEGQEKNQLLHKSIQAFTRAIEILPKYSDAWGQRGLAYYRLKQHEAAIYDYNQSTKYNPNNATTWSNLGSLYFQTQKYQEAKYAYEQAIRTNPNHIDALANYASTLGTLGEFNTAITYFKKAVALNPNEPSYYQYIGITYQSLGNQQQANIYLQKAQQLRTK
jgi:Flp pilus assembly protein TadD